MQSDREKLIALLVEAESLCAAFDCFDGAVCEYAGEINGCTAFRADHLIYNGVVVREKGEWEWFEEWNPSTPDHPAECDDCGWRCGRCKAALEDMVGGYWDNPDEKPQLDFCPNCGSDMRKGENG